MASTMMQKFWDSALALEPPDDLDTHRYELSLVIMMLGGYLIVFYCKPLWEFCSEMSAFMASEGTLNYPSLGLGNSFTFKFEDLKGRVHRVNCGECWWFFRAMILKNFITVCMHAYMCVCVCEKYC